MQCLTISIDKFPRTFQGIISVVLHEWDDFAMAYLDDIIIFSLTLEEHMKHIQKVFHDLRQCDLKLKLPKCKFIQDQTQYLGFVINENGIMADPEKTRLLKQLSPPTTVKEVLACLVITKGSFQISLR